VLPEGWWQGKAWVDRRDRMRQGREAWGGRRSRRWQSVRGGNNRRSWPGKLNKDGRSWTGELIVIGEGTIIKESIACFDGFLCLQIPYSKPITVLEIRQKNGCMSFRVKFLLSCVRNFVPDQTPKGVQIIEIHKGTA
jgi:hypothetical protein